MKIKFLPAALLFPLLASAGVQYNESDLRVRNMQVTKVNQQINVRMDLDYTNVPLKSSQEMTVTPVLRSGNDEIVMPTVVFAGRQRYYYRLRNNDTGVPLMRSGKEATMAYEASFPYQPWMNNSELVVNYRVDGCCGNQLASFSTPLQSVNFTPPAYTAEYVYIPPQAEKVKIRQESGTAYIDFVVNRTDINPGYRNNAAELAKITTTVNNVKNDPDITITGMSIKGFASPEGNYENNVRLAKGRTAALEQYVQDIYQFPDGFIKTSSDPSNFDGLKDYLMANDIAEKDGILAILNSDLSPYDKNMKIRTSYPGEYAWLLKNVYPGLRKSDYKIDYTVRSYTDVAEIFQVMKVAPQKLSLSEFYLAAQSLQPGTDAFNEVFDIAVRMFPNDEIANLNAANSAMQRGDLVSASKYLNKAGNSNEVLYAQGVLAALRNDHATAMQIFSRLQNVMPQAAEALGQLQAIKDFNGK